jgi:hypothetical protein
MGFGTSSYGTGPFGLADNAALAEQQGQLTSSRKLDSIGRPVQLNDGTGAFEGMSDAMARAYVLLKLSTRPVDKITATYSADEQSRIRTALAILTDAKPPLVEIVSIETADSGTTARTLVKLRDLTDGGKERVLPASPRSY